MAWVATIIGSVVRSVLAWFGEYLRLWYTEQKSRENEWAAETRKAMLESFKTSLKVEQAISKAGATHPRSPAEWNVGRSVLVLAVVWWAGAGCFTRYVYVESRYPIIEIPQRPAVPTQPVAWTAREEILVGYAASLEAAIDRYNEAAKEHNRKHGYGQ